MSDPLESYVDLIIKIGRRQSRLKIPIDNTLLNHLPIPYMHGVVDEVADAIKTEIGLEFANG